MSVNTLYFARMGNDDIITDVGVMADSAYYTIQYAENSIMAGGKVNAFVKLKLTGYRMNSPAKTGGLS